MMLFGSCRVSPTRLQSKIPCFSSFCFNLNYKQLCFYPCFWNLEPELIHAFSIQKTSLCENILSPNGLQELEVLMLVLILFHNS